MVCIVLIDSLAELICRATQPEALNDPYECFPEFPHGSEYLSMLKEQYSKSLESVNFQKMSIDDARLLFIHRESMFQDEVEQYTNGDKNSFYSSYINSVRSHFNSSIGIISLSRNWNNSIMWSHYASSHCGYVIGFDEEDNYFQAGRAKLNSKVSYCNVDYKKDRVRMPYSMNEIPDLSLLHTKSIEWNYEAEFRLLIPLKFTQKVGCDINGFPIYLFKYPKRIIKEIYIGLYAKQALVEQLVTFAKENNIAAYKCDLSDTGYKMERKSIL